ncbi:CDP-glycerol glycerophosphotransferase family protein [Parabacteroides acidifaciens]|uniref:CDP-glycerol glycerophosphotransferase family protein n=1 Tax=Parabacteroides acidifaciens TaxID=2290935 RepID=A0A3D8HI02_9BACT|nr:CDP-glycerol glycerophosphotransferase family protein [Parabacteroides acidifaciens]MBC8600840.1 CDP-glycerol glycerophosphotransferase family protein [Parabacteroides acidifaciens]RDU50561.1 CDP-glycerol--glycerophosphate glycerophosphotransferase [Parabacteroides acidifaciens]
MKYVLKIMCVIKSILPYSFKKRLLNLFYYFRFRYNYWLNHSRYLHIEKRIAKQKNIKVVFFVTSSYEWKADELYLLLENSPRFIPYIVICPIITQGQSKMIEDIKSAELFFSKKRYRYYNSYNNETKKWMDVNKEIMPDIVFFASPYRGLTLNRYYIYNYSNSLSCYIPYGFMIANIEQHQFNEYFHNLLWKGFYETNIHKKMAAKYALNRGENIIVSGYPQCDQFCKSTSSYDMSVWKNTSKSMKRLIWAPHHTIEKNNVDISYSNFLEYADFMLEVADNYFDKIQIAFKPHPLLKYKLYAHKEWGKDKTDNYFECWRTRTNTQLEEGNYVDLFMTSDGMVMDSISFMAEYLFTKKPSLFMVAGNTRSNFNDFGKLVFDLLYKSDSKETLLYFIDKILLEGEDVKKQERLDFLNTVLLPPNHLSASQNIFNTLNQL